MAAINQHSKDASLPDRLKSSLLYPLPHHLISRIIFKLTRLKASSGPFIRWFVRQYKVDMSEAENPDTASYATFNTFFTRALKPSARPIADQTEHLACPADGTVSAIGNIANNQLFQAKGRNYSLLELLGGNHAEAARFAQGCFTTIYLSPRDYHRVHMPETGRLCSQTHIPGRLFSVAPHTVRCVPNLFARNERLVCRFDTSGGAMAVIMVGAINVAAIETVWAGLVTPPAGKKLSHIEYQAADAVSIAKGDEMGRFNMGSTVILLHEHVLEWNSTLQPGVSVKMGQAITVSKPLPTKG